MFLHRIRKFVGRSSTNNLKVENTEGSSSQLLVNNSLRIHHIENWFSSPFFVAFAGLTETLENLIRRRDVM